MKDGIEIVNCRSTHATEWERYVQASPEATLCHEFRWYDVIAGAYGHRPFYLLARRNGRPAGILPLFLVKSCLFGKSLVSMPFLDYGGICAGDDATHQELIGTALRIMREEGAQTLELRQCEPPVGLGPDLHLNKVTMVLDLTVGVESLWRSLPAKVRNQVRKAEKSGLKVSIGGGDLLDEFYPIFAVNMRDLGSPVHHRRFFQELFGRFADQAKLFIIRDGERAVGGLVAVRFKDTLLVPWASSLRDYFSKCPNNLLYWEAIKHACEQGLRRFDFGRSSVGSGTYHFKRQWGAAPAQIYWQRWSEGGKCRPPISADNPRYRMAIKLWQRLPVRVATAVGPRLRKYITA